MTRLRNRAIALLFCLLVAGCTAARKGDEIMACGQLIHTGARVILWNDPCGFSAYQSAPGVEFNERSPELLQNPNLPALQQTIDQFVIHYDGCGSSRECFHILHDERHLSVQFMLDLDGTIYQTLDLKERAWHATISNTRSIGIEIANIGAFTSPNDPALVKWKLEHPEAGVLKSGIVQGEMRYQYDFTPQQYEALIRLTAALCKTFPRITCDYPRENRKLPDAQLVNFHGVLGHFHIQTNKEDPGPAFDWERVIRGARMVG